MRGDIMTKETSAQRRQAVLDALRRAMIGDKARDWYDQQAKEKYEATVGRPSKSVETVPPISEKVKARDQAGKAVGVSGKTMDKATDHDDVTPAGRTPSGPTLLVGVGGEIVPCRAQ